MRYAIWNNKGGVGKSFLTFMMATEVAHNNPDTVVLVADMCPQANLSEIILGGNSTGAARLESILSEGRDRRTIGGYFDRRIASPHAITGSEGDYLIRAEDENINMPPNLYLLVGDPSLEIQAQVINQISGQTLPEDAWKNVHCWLRDLITANTGRRGDSHVTFIDCNPSFSAYTGLSMVAAERLIVPCSSDGSSARAIDNIGALVYGLNGTGVHAGVGFHAKARQFGISLPLIHSVVLNRSTQYNKKASKAFGAMFQAIKDRVMKMKSSASHHFAQQASLFFEIPDNHSVAIVCSHQGKPLYQIRPGQYSVHDQNPQVNNEPLDRYKAALDEFRSSL